MNIVILIKSSGALGYERHAGLARQLWAIERFFGPVFEAGDHAWSVCVYAQGYSPGVVPAIQQQCSALRWVDETPKIDNSAIGAISQRAVEAFAPELDTADLVIWMDADLEITFDAMTAQNLQMHLHEFEKTNRSLYAFALGVDNTPTILLLPLVSECHPYMPGMGKMMWLKPSVLRAAVALDGFGLLVSGDDMVIAATAWLKDPHACNQVYGLGAIKHLQLEGNADPLENFTIICESIGAIPADVYPDLFLPRDHPRAVFGGIRVEEIARTERGTTDDVLAMESM